MHNIYIYIYIYLSFIVFLFNVIISEINILFHLNMHPQKLPAVNKRPLNKTRLMNDNGYCERSLYNLISLSSSLLISGSETGV